MLVPTRCLPSGTIVVEVPMGDTSGRTVVRDMVEVLSSMCALYGQRGARHRAMRAVTASKRDSVDGVPV
jgi:putative resolvase